MRIERLTPEQEALLPVYRDKWLAVGLSTAPADRPAAEAGVRQAYESASLAPPTIFIWLQSPLAGCIGAAMLTGLGKKGHGKAQVGDQVRAQVGDQVWDQVGDQVGAQVWDQVRAQVWAQVGDQVWDQVGDQVGAQVWDQVRAQVRAQVGDQVWAQVRAQVGDQVRAQVGDQVRDQVRAQVRAQVYKAGYGQHDASWLGFYDMMSQLPVKGCERLAGLMAVAASSGWFWPFRGACILTERPTELHRDAQHRLHRDGGPALLYPDGWGIYAWHGTRIPEEWGKLKAADWDPRWLLSQENADRRRILIQGLGYDRIMSGLDSKLVHQDGSMELRRIDGADVEPIVLLKVECPSTGMFYTLRVPPEMTECERARQWTFGDEPLRLLQEA